MRMGKVGGVIAAIAMSYVLSACATIVSGTTQNVTVESEPEGATCKLVRASQTIGAIANTPGTLRLNRSKDDISVVCDKEGYQQATETLSASFTGATIGNVLFGGLIGVAIDASSGANHRYPEYALLVLSPGEFPTETARDEYFARVREKIRSRADASIEKVKKECAPQAADLCATNVRKIEEARDQEYAEVELKRLGAKVAARS